MNLKEHLLVVFAEECAETQQAISKALRFGMNDSRQGSESNNRCDIEKEFIEAIAVRDMLIELGVITQPENSQEIYDNKKKRVGHYVGYARNLGTINNDR